MEADIKESGNGKETGLLERVLGRISSEKNFLGSKKRVVYFSLFLIAGCSLLVFALFSLKHSVFTSGMDSLPYFLYAPHSAVFAARETLYFILEGLPAGSIAIAFFAAALILIFLKHVSKNIHDSVLWSKKIKKYKDGGK
ncbi:MAG: hypothetical protein LiPW15_208 [Parcubacteria group bacterium LiPW_15]|nr:MAG: hypothetical protein LiPW15_208 [Parcubacteria group bacterium LiPW_15]